MTEKEKRKTRVYHARSWNFRASEKPHSIRRSAYVLVAEVDTFDLDEAFALTNHFDGDWADNEGVKALVEQRRSTSVGDIIVPPGGEAYLVLRCGFRCLGRV
jgi:hypothetical protein